MARDAAPAAAIEQWTLQRRRDVLRNGDSCSQACLTANSRWSRLLWDFGAYSLASKVSSVLPAHRACMSTGVRGVQRHSMVTPTPLPPKPSIPAINSFASHSPNPAPRSPPAIPGVTSTSRAPPCSAPVSGHDSVSSSPPVVHSSRATPALSHIVGCHHRLAVPVFLRGKLRRLASSLILFSKCCPITEDGHLPVPRQDRAIALGVTEHWMGLAASDVAVLCMSLVHSLHCISGPPYVRGVREVRVRFNAFILYLRAEDTVLVLDNYAAISGASICRSERQKNSPDERATG